MSLCVTYPLGEATLLEGFCAGILPLTGVQLRSIVAVGPADFVTLERGTESVVVAEDLDGDGIPEKIRTLVSLEGLNHGLALTATHLYASTPSNVYRWLYNPVTKTVPSPDSPELVIENIDAGGNHVTRTLAINPVSDTIYVSVGSGSNVDNDSARARIRSFSLLNSQLFPLDFQQGTVFADGLRNEVALDFAPDGSLWGANNGPDSLIRNDLGGPDMFNDNPAEEVHRFDMAGGQNYGYPYCFREYYLPNTGLGRGTPWAWPSFLNDGTVTDQQCRDNYDAPVLAMQAHTAPLGMTFYKYSATRPSPECDGVEPFPESMDGDAFIALHGSWNRYVATGYKVVRVPVTDDGTGVVGGIGADPVDLLKHQGDDARWSDGFRPVDVSFDACGRLLVSSDGTAGITGRQGAMIVRIDRVTSGTPDNGFSLLGWFGGLFNSLTNAVLIALSSISSFFSFLFGGSN